MEGISGVPAPIPHSKLAGPDKVGLGGPGPGLAAQTVNRPLVKVESLSAVASMSPAERSEYIQSTGREATSRAVAKVVDILA